LVCLTDLHCNPPVKFVEFCDVCSSRIFCSFLLIFFLFFSDDASYASAAKRPPKQQLLLNEIDLTHFIEGDNGQKKKRKNKKKICTREFYCCRREKEEERRTAASNLAEGPEIPIPIPDALPPLPLSPSSSIRSSSRVVLPRPSPSLSHSLQRPRRSTASLQFLFFIFCCLLIFSPFFLFCTTFFFLTALCSVCGSLAAASFNALLRERARGQVSVCPAQWW